MDNRINNSQPPSPPDDPNYAAMLKSLSELQADYDEIVQDLQKNPPDITQANKLLNDMLQEAQKLSGYAGGALAITPVIQQMIGTIQDMQVLLQSSDVTGCLLLMQSAKGDFTTDLSSIRQFVLYPGQLPILPGKPDYMKLLQTYLLFQKDLKAFREDIQKGDFNDADILFGRISSLAHELYQYSNNNPLLTPLLGNLVGRIDDIGLLLEQNPPNFKGCLSILNQLFAS